MMLEIRKTAVFDKWLKGLRSKEAHARITTRIDRLADGNPGDVKPVGNGISELRIPYGPGYRVYYVKRGKTIIVLLCGGNKGSQARDIKAARTLAETLEE